MAGPGGLLRRKRRREERSESRHSPFAFRHSPFAFRLSPFAFRLSPFAFRLSPFAFLCNQRGAAMPDPNRPLSEGKLAVLKRLKLARDDADDIGEDVRQFAVNINELVAAKSEVLWLMKARWVHHFYDVTRDGESRREFRAATDAPLRDNSCFVLSDLGRVYVERHILAANGVAQDDRKPKPSRRARERPKPRQRRGLKLSGEPCSSGQASASPRPLPDWRPIEGELHFRGELVWQCGRKGAVLVELLLTRFAPGWPESIVNPFGDTAEAHQQLKEAVRRLNNTLRGSLLQFHVRRNGGLALWKDCAMTRGKR